MSSDPVPDSSKSLRATLLPGLGFVLMWSTGYVAAAFALRGMGPFTLAAWRFLGSATLVVLLLLLAPAPRLRGRAWLHAALAGLMLHAGFFGFTYAGLRAGVPAAVAGLVAGLMPLVTTLGGALLLREPLRATALAGFVLGLAGVLLVVLPGLHAGGPVFGYVCVGLALLSLSGGTLYQKRFGGTGDPRWSLLMQLAASAAVLVPLGWTLERLQVRAQPEALAGLGWAILVNSTAALLLYLWLLAQGAAGRVASLFYLVPPATALLAAALLGTRFELRDGAGFALAATGVWLGQRA